MDGTDTWAQIVYFIHTQSREPLMLTRPLLFTIQAHQLVDNLHLHATTATDVVFMGGNTINAPEHFQSDCRGYSPSRSIR
jgi:hypothetical protein